MVPPFPMLTYTLTCKAMKNSTNDILREQMLPSSLIVGKRCNFQELHYRKTTVTHIKTLPGAINHHHKFIVYYPTEGQKGLMCCLFLSEHTNDPPVILSFKDH